MNSKLKKLLPVLIVLIIAIVFSAIMIPKLSAKSSSAFQSKCVYIPSIFQQTPKLQEQIVMPVWKFYI